eukprot:gene3040-5050_t
MLKLEDVQIHFDKPIHEASACLGVQIHDLKKVLHENNLKRWPCNGFRKVPKRNDAIDSPFKIIQFKKPIPTKYPPLKPAIKIIKPKKTLPSILPSFQTLVRSIQTQQPL